MKALSFLLIFFFIALLCIFVEGKNKGKPTKNLVNSNGKKIGLWKVGLFEMNQTNINLVLFVADSVFSYFFQTMFAMGAVKAIPDLPSVITGGNGNRAVLYRVAVEALFSNGKRRSYSQTTACPRNRPKRRSVADVKGKRRTVFCFHL